ncbi:hypothetical protein KCW65_21430, partial [Mycobacterium tuberculosis]|nr:hypothetical protein [Mycobacterium tuberculosis]
MRTDDGRLREREGAPETRAAVADPDELIPSQGICSRGVGQRRRGPRAAGGVGSAAGSASGSAAGEHVLDHGHDLLAVEADRGLP